MSTAREKKYECIGGPICGRRVECNGEGLIYEDGEGQNHFYRLIRVAKNDFSAFAKFYHYFGTNFAAADTAHPTLRPPERLFRAKKTR